MLVSQHDMNSRDVGFVEHRDDDDDERPNLFYLLMSITNAKSVKCILCLSSVHAFFLILCRASLCGCLHVGKQFEATINQFLKQHKRMKEKKISSNTDKRHIYSN